MLITPFLLGSSSQMPNMAGFFGIFLFLCFHAVFSELPVFSHVFPAILVNSLANKCSIPTELGFCYSKQRCLFYSLKSLRSEYGLKRYKGVCFAAAHPAPKVLALDAAVVKKTNFSGEMSTCPNLSQGFHCNFMKKRVRISRINCMQFYSVSKKLDLEALFCSVKK